MEKGIFLPTLNKSSQHRHRKHTIEFKDLYRKYSYREIFVSLAVIASRIRGKCSIPELVSGGLAALLRLFGDLNQSCLRPAVRKFRLRYLCSRPHPQLRLTESAKVLTLYNHY